MLPTTPWGTYYYYPILQIQNRLGLSGRCAITPLVRGRPDSHPDLQVRHLAPGHPPPGLSPPQGLAHPAYPTRAEASGPGCPVLSWRMGIPGTQWPVLPRPVHLRRETWWRPLTAKVKQSWAPGAPPAAGPRGQPRPQGPRRAPPTAERAPPPAPPPENGLGPARREPAHPRPAHLRPPWRTRAAPRQAAGASAPRAAGPHATPTSPAPAPAPAPAQAPALAPQPPPRPPPQPGEAISCFPSHGGGRGRGRAGGGARRRGGAEGNRQRSEVGGNGC